jgi:photosystem II stability/assembly factor-like uncharacterized protein
MNNYLKKYTLISLPIIFILIIVVNSITIEEKEYENEYEEEEFEKEEFSAQGAYEYLQRIRTNQYSKSIDLSDIRRAESKIKELKARKSIKENPWILRGPDNIGGRTRALLIDRDNSNLMFAGGVGGGVWKSTTAGQYWERVEYDGATPEDFANLIVSSICQSINGDIYFGTGEGFSPNHGTNLYTPMILGAGIWKSTDRGQSFFKLTSTNDDAFSLVNKLAADSLNKDIIYAATKGGLKVTKDGGLSWDNAPMDNPIFNNQYSTDVKTAKDGAVIASVNNRCLVKKAGDTKFINKSGLDEEDGGDLITIANVGRLEFAYAPQDPNTIFCVVATEDGGLRNIYKSVNGGDSWIIIGKGESSLFQPLGDQGKYDLCISVNPQNKNQVFLGGIDLWVGDKAKTGNLFAWNQVSLWSLDERNPNYIHADLHTIIFDPKNPKTMFIGNDGGVSCGYIDKDNIDFQFHTLNKNYNATQFYSIACNSKGNLLGGTQDNGSIIIDGAGNTDSNGRKILGGDGGHSAMSQINPSIAFATIYYGGLWRNNDKDFADWNTFYNSDIADYQGWTSGTWEPETQQASFVTPIAYWETDKHINTIDTISFLARKYYPADTTIVVKSHNIYNANITLKLYKEYNINDTIFYKDTYTSLFALGMKRNIWLTRKASNWNSPIAQKDWWRAIKRGTLSRNEYITQMEFSTDGNHLFFSTSENDIYRLSNLNNALTYDDADYIYGKNIITKLTKIGNAGARTITDIAIDPNNIDNIIVTLGNYGNNNYVYMCSKASTVNESANLSNFIDITGNLPKIPTYCALFEMNKQTKEVMLGTDMGVFVSNNVFAQVSNTNTEWEPKQNGIGNVPVFQITQQTKTYPWTVNYGRIYIGTHGLGIFEDRTYESISDNNNHRETISNTNITAKIFPNPVTNNAKVSITSNITTNVKIDIINMSGQIVKSIDKQRLINGSNTISLQLNDIEQGVYLLKIDTDNTNRVIRFMKK